MQPLEFSPPRRALARIALFTVLICVIGGVAGFVASLFPVPLPYLLGSLVFTAILALSRPRAIPAGYEFPVRFRMLFVALIGILIGSQVRPELLTEAPRMAISLAGVALFVPLAQAWNYAVFRKLGGYDRATAFYSGAPGGLMEAIAMGDSAGANTALLVTQQFLRIILVISLVPLGISLWLGVPAGSAAGIGLGPGNGAPGASFLATIDPLHGLIAIAAAALGLTLGKRLHFPAWQLTGALLLSACAALAGLPLVQPGWLVALAQVVIGTSLGLRFAGMGRRLLLRGIGLSFVSVAGMLLLGAGFALVLRQWVGQDFEVLLITFAPGGINEMALVALSLHANPAFVTFHHVFRIVFTVVVMGVLQKRLLPERP